MLSAVPTAFSLSFLGLVVSFHLLAPFFPSTKQTSWILTTLASAGMSLASLPFLWDYLSNEGRVTHVRTLPAFAVMANRFFQAYLAADLTIGTLYYRSRISFLEGWIHHSLYILIVELAIRRSWTHIFCLCGSMEIPTFILGITILYPRLRSNILFAVSFFMTRITLHVILAVSYLPRNNRMHTTGGSFVPATLLAGIFPLHVMWFRGCLRGFVKRASQKDPGQTPPVVEFSIVPGASTTSPIAPRPINPSELSCPPHNRFRPYRLRLSYRRQPFSKAFRSLRLDLTESPSSKHVLLSGTITAYSPLRETVYDYVGLGRKMGHQPMTDSLALGGQT
ncbi:hypothetical protein FPV67DRAFT_1416858 [Lyophyllum atratum]|nr:hypothetical protein FPV67DRAFT_1416858 [Lyophyllum atratum]